MSTRRHMKRLDDRTGRLERAVNLVNDGVIPGIKVARGEADRPHPQSRTKVIGLDRALLKAPKPPDVSERNLTIEVGLFGNSNFERDGMPVCVHSTSWGDITFLATGSLGYGDEGFGEFGYGGFSDEEYFLGVTEEDGF